MFAILTLSIEMPIVCYVNKSKTNVYVRFKALKASQIHILSLVNTFNLLAKWGTF